MNGDQTSRTDDDTLDLDDPFYDALMGRQRKALAPVPKSEKFDPWAASVKARNNGWGVSRSVPRKFNNG